jgi:hypothetical protein
MGVRFNMADLRISEAISVQVPMVRPAAEIGWECCGENMPLPSRADLTSAADSSEWPDGLPGPGPQSSALIDRSIRNAGLISFATNPGIR